ncbi:MULTISPECIES: ribosome silencing factor [Segatella]|jgi:ribosome-associated protein|uniref:Ribosomal silencing factor RsfS n=1 Tax=Segatella bryantii TaxID=77095 RepID=A0ABX4EJD1_SEGBR|nr:MULTISPECIES: ribosome silencing factor [Segatella]MBQ3857243.1 ribosome silencing factor [Prevotella sp.]MBQ5558344.1 ribosome silencing factor [Lachnospiraceae bacterium]MDR4929694.1 ribosome silencing factor [Segatella bryantii]MEE3415403.1 ribosome silencing factor [Prevotella sp.]OYP56407.1 ribosome silencing factor RsfS [Segatella bryantii]
MNTVKESTQQLVNTIVEGIQEKKGSGIVIADLSHIDGSIAQYFVICQGNSPSQVEAIAESVGEFARNKNNEKPINVVGLGTNQWVAIDFADILVHIFLPETREFYNLEDLWEDAKLTRIPDIY